MPFQERLLEQIELARTRGHHRNLLVAATGTGKTVMAAVDYARLRERLPRDRLLFVAHREEILEQSRATFRHALRDASFGELWVGGQRPQRFEHVFASIQSLNAVRTASRSTRGTSTSSSSTSSITRRHRRTRRFSSTSRRVELLGLTATPERADGLDVLRYFDGRIAAELRVWDAIDQQYLVPFSYFGVHDGTDLREVPWKRGTGYDLDALTNVFTADHAWARRVVEQLRRKIGDPHGVRALGFCVIDRARALHGAAVPCAPGSRRSRVWGDSPMTSGRRRCAISQLAASTSSSRSTCSTKASTFRTSTRCCCFVRPRARRCSCSNSAAACGERTGKALCTVLDFVGNHRREFRFDRQLRALLGGTRREVERQVERDFPFLPSRLPHGARSRRARHRAAQHPPGDPVRLASEVDELRSLGDVSLATYLEETGLELEDVYANNSSWSELRRAVGLPTDDAGPERGRAPAGGRTTPARRRPRAARRLHDRLSQRRSAPDRAALDRSRTSLRCAC